MGKICNEAFNEKKSRRQEVLRDITVAKFKRTPKKMSVLEIVLLCIFTEKSEKFILEDTCRMTCSKIVFASDTFMI